MNSQTFFPDSDSNEPEHLSSRMLEKRIMMSIALLGSFVFGFIFFGHAPSIIGLLVFLGPMTEANVAAKILGIAGIIIMGFSLRYRETSHWLPLTTAGSFAFLTSWGLFFNLVDGNFTTFLGTLPFLFFSLWFLRHLIRETGIFSRLNERFAVIGEGSLVPQRRLVTFASIFSFLTEPLRKWLNVEELEGEKKAES